MSSHYVQIPLFMLTQIENKLCILLGYQMAQDQSEVDAAGTKQLIEQIESFRVVKVGA